MALPVVLLPRIVREMRIKMGLRSEMGIITPGF